MRALPIIWPLTRRDTATGASCSDRWTALTKSPRQTSVASRKKHSPPITGPSPLLKRQSLKSPSLRMPARKKEVRNEDGTLVACRLICQLNYSRFPFFLRRRPGDGLEADQHSQAARVSSAGAQAN